MGCSLDTKSPHFSKGLTLQGQVDLHLKGHGPLTHLNFDSNLLGGRLHLLQTAIGNIWMQDFLNNIESQTAVTMDGLLVLWITYNGFLMQNGKSLGSSQLPKQPLACQWQLARLRHRGAAAPALMADDSCIDSPQPPIFTQSLC